MKRTLSLVLLAGALLAGSCGKTQPKPVDRAGQLLGMAADEAANIGNTMDRFTRQLNIADLQLRTDRKPDAARSLALARDTLDGSRKEDFDDFHRIAAWTAISQLARGAEAKDLALKASDNALAALNDVQPATERPQYVLSLASELAELRGKDSAVELLNSGASWVADIGDIDVRRTALVAFTNRLIELEAFDAARNTIRRDPDPAWRTDTFLFLANSIQPLPNNPTVQAAAYASAGGSGGAGMRRGGGGFGDQMKAMAPATLPAANARQQEFNVVIRKAGNYGKDVRYENVYQQQGQ